MDIPETGEIVTPLDDPCQFNPAWRSIIADYFVAIGITGIKELESISKFGGVTVTNTSSSGDVTVTKEIKNIKKSKSKKRQKAAKSTGKTADSTVQEPASYFYGIPPFDSHPEYRLLALDKWIVEQVEFLVVDGGGRCRSNKQNKPNQPGASYTQERHIPYKLARRYYEEMEHEAAMKKRIEPLLLTEIDMDIIAMDLIGAVSARPIFEVYEKLYFNCRDENFNLNPSMQLIQRFAMPFGPLRTWVRKGEVLDNDGFIIGDGRPLARESDVWRAVAATMGYEALMYVWRWNNKAHGMKNNSVEHMLELAWKASISQLISQLYTGDVRHEDAAKLLSAFTAQSKKISDDRANSGDDDETTVAKTLMAVLYQTAPKMVSASQSTQERNAEIQSRIQSQLAISRQTIDDKGVQVNAEVMDAQISNAIEGA